MTTISKAGFATALILLTISAGVGCTAMRNAFPTASSAQPSTALAAPNPSGDQPPTGAGPSAAEPAGNPGPASTERVIYFAFDSFDVRPESKPVIEAHARYLAADPARTAILEAHTDERGTREYNIALAERRAEAVRRLLAAYGVAARQVRTLSYGEEQPALVGHSETDYAQNRRVEITY